VQPNFTVTTPGPVYSPIQAAFLSVMSVVLYGIFLGMQTSRHRDYFVSPGAPAGETEPHSPGHEVRSIPYHAVMLFAYIVPLVALSKQIGVPINHAIQVLRAPPELAGFLVSVLILSPESLSAVRAALANQLQRSVNILLGSVLASIGLTIPAVLAVGFATGHEIILGLGATDMTFLVLTLVLSMLTFAAQRTNVLLGAVHLVVFFAYLLFIFER
jgi:Ca2+:H+ antiporter